MSIWISLQNTTKKPLLTFFTKYISFILHNKKNIYKHKKKGGKL